MFHLVQCGTSMNKMFVDGFLCCLLAVAFCFVVVLVAYTLYT